jgi:putative transposase
MVQQQALRDFAHAMASFFAGTHRQPSWRKAGRDEGFRIVALKPKQVQQLSRRMGQVWVPKADGSVSAGLATFLSRSPTE